VPSLFEDLKSSMHIVRSFGGAPHCLVREFFQKLEDRFIPALSRMPEQHCRTYITVLMPANGLEEMTHKENPRPGFASASPYDRAGRTAARLTRWG
jgi:hypothetical protein